MTDVVSFSIARSQAAVTELNGNVEQALEKRNLPPAVSFAVQLVIEELTTNIVKDGTGAPSDSLVGVRLLFETGAVVVEIENQGDRFNPFERPDPNLNQSIEDRQIGGLGIHLSRKMMDEYEYAYRNGTNFIMLRKKFPLDQVE